MNLEFKDLIREYDGKRVLEIRQGAVETGSRTAIIGPNGAGKSTLINLIAGLDTPTGGRILYDGKEELPFRDMTLVFQKPYLISTTVEKNIAYPLGLRRVCKEDAKKRAEELMEELGLTEFARRKTWKLSGGEIQKVALARALSFHPRLLLLDEPTANIDPTTTAEIEKMLIKINRCEGTTIIMITHNLVQARRVCDQCMFLNKGNLIEAGASDLLLTEPKEEETRRFVAGELLL